MKNKYELVRIKGKNPYCDDKISAYVEACDKILLTNIFKFPCNKKDVESVKKIYISANIESIKLIDVPVTNILTEDEKQLKEKKLYIVGNVIEKIEYITANSCKKIDSFTAKIPFSKYISIDCNYIEGMNDYCVTAFIKTVCVEVINKRCLKEKIELILSAYKKDEHLAELNENNPLNSSTPLNTSNGLNIDKQYKNTIKFYGENNLEVAKVELDINNKIFKVTSTNNIANLNFSDEKYFEVLLKDLEGNIKVEAVVMGNETGEIFSQTLNGFKFEYSDILELNYEENNRVEISNLAKENYIAYNPKGNSESYGITSKGLIFIEDLESEVINSIIIKGKNSEFMAQINLINVINKLQVVSSSKIINNDFSESEYFAIVFNDIEGNLKKEVILKGNENANKLVEELNNFKFEYDDTIVLRYKQGYNISITNFQGREEYNPTGNISEYIISPEGLIADESTVSKILNSIIVNNKTLEPIAKIDLIEDSNKILVMSSGILANEGFENDEFFSLTLKDSTERIKIESEIMDNENANSFAIDLNEYSFNYNDIIELKCSNSKNIIITNYKGEKSYNLVENIEKFVITISGLEKIENVVYY